MPLLPRLPACRDGGQPRVLRERLVHLDQDGALSHAAHGVEQANEPVPLAEAVEPHARPGRQVVTANLVVADGEAHEGKLLDEAVDGGEDDALATQVDVAAVVSARAGLVLAVVAEAVVDRRQVVGSVDVHLRLDVRVEALGRRVRQWQRDRLRGEKGDGQGQRFATGRRRRLGLGWDMWTVTLFFPPASQPRCVLQGEG